MMNFMNGAARAYASGAGAAARKGFAQAPGMMKKAGGFLNSNMSVGGATYAGAIGGGIYGGTAGRDSGQSRMGGALTGALGGGLLGRLGGAGYMGGRRTGRAYSAMAPGRTSAGQLWAARGLGAGRGMARQMRRDAMNSGSYIGRGLTKAYNKIGGFSSLGMGGLGGGV